MGNHSYVLVTPAHNEERNIERTIASVTAQTVLPLRWVIVNDGSTDDTGQIIRRFAEQCNWIRSVERKKSASEFTRVEKVAPGKVAAVRLGLAQCQDLEFDYFGNLDADISIPMNYYEVMLTRMQADQAIGLIGGYITNAFQDGKPAPGGMSNPNAVAGAIQLFRLDCYKQIGGYKPYGHEDCIAVSSALQAGWKVQSLSSVVATHHVDVDEYDNTMKVKIPALFYMGRMDYVSRTPFWFTCIHALVRMGQRPYIAAGVARMIGHVTSLVRRDVRLPRTHSHWAAYWRHILLIAERLRRRSGSGGSGENADNE